MGDPLAVVTTSGTAVAASGGANVVADVNFISQFVNSLGPVPPHITSNNVDLTTPQAQAILAVPAVQTYINNATQAVYNNLISQFAPIIQQAAGPTILLTASTLVKDYVVTQVSANSQSFVPTPTPSSAQTTVSVLTTPVGSNIPATQTGSIDWLIAAGAGVKVAGLI